MQSVLLAGNGSFQNHGCEAISRGTIEVLRKTFGKELRISYASGETLANCQKDLAFIPGESITAYPFLAPFQRYSRAWVEYQINRFTPTGLAGGFRHLQQPISQADAVMAISGDNYSFDYGYPEPYIQFDRLVLNQGKPLIYWGLSVGPFSADKQYEQKMRAHLARVTAILVRESGSMAYLRSIGIEKNVHLVADPAFAMKPEQPDPTHFVLDRKDFLGVNFSTTVGRMSLPNLNESDPRQEYLRTGVLKTKTAYDQMCLKYADLAMPLSDLCGGNLVFIPHAMGNDIHSDYKFMKAVAAILESRGYASPLVVPPDLTAPEYKWIIAQARFFVGARTHATLAAFATGVPTITLSYSLKARGITRDMYGTDEFSISGKDVSPEPLANLVKRLMSQEDQLRQHLGAQAVVMKDRAYSAGEIAKNILA